MTPKFRPPAFRRLLIAAAGASLAFSAATITAKAASFTWIGDGGAGGNGTWDGIGIYHTFNDGTKNIGYTYDGTTSNHVTFSSTAVVTISGASPVLGGSGTITIVSAAAKQAAVTLQGGGIYGGVAGVDFLTVRTYIDPVTGKATNASLTLSNINYFDGKVVVDGDLTISNTRALGKTGSGNGTSVSDGGSLTITGGITTVAEDLDITGSGSAGTGALVSASGNNVYTGTVSVDPLSSGGITLVSVLNGTNASGSLTFTGNVSCVSTTTNPDAYLQVQTIKTSSATASATFSGGIDLGDGTLQATGGGSVTIGTAPVTGSRSSSIIVGGGSTLNLNTNNSGFYGRLILGDSSGAGNLVTGSTGALSAVGSIIVDSGSLKIGSYNSSADLYVGTSGIVEITDANVDISGYIINQTSITNGLKFSAASGTVILESGLGVGNPNDYHNSNPSSPGSTYFASSADIRGDGIADGNIVVERDLSTTDITGGNVTVKGALISTGIISTTDGLPATTVTVSGNADINEIDGGYVTIFGTASIGTLASTSNAGDLLDLRGASSIIDDYQSGSIALSNNSKLTVNGGNMTGEFSGVSLKFDTSSGRVVVGGALNSSKPVTFNISASVASIAGGTVTFSQDSSLGSMTGGEAVVATGKFLTLIGSQSSGSVISGDGGILFSTIGATNTVKGNNTYQGGTELVNGTVCIGNNSALGTGVITIYGGGLASLSKETHAISNNIDALGEFTLGDALNNGALTITGDIDFNGGSRKINVNSDVTIAGDLLNGGFEKLGTGKLTITGQTFLSLGVTITKGTLAGTTSNLSGDYTVGGILELSQDTDGIFSGNISGTGGFVKSGTGTVTLTSANNYTGGTSVTGGTLLVTADNIEGNVKTSGSGVIEFNQTSAGIYDGTFTGTGTIKKTGDSTLTLNGLATAGNITVESGTLIENGGLVGNIEVKSAGTLKGSGSITGNVTINGGTMSVGNSPGVVNLTSGNHYQNGGIYIADVGGTSPGTGNGFHDQYNLLHGTFTITGNAKLSLNSWVKSDGVTPFTPVRGDSFNIINASGGLSGGFYQFDNNIDPTKLILFAQHTGVVYATGLTTAQTFENWAGADTFKKSVYKKIWDLSVTTGNSTTASGYIDGSAAEGKLAIAIIKGTADTAYKVSDFSAESYFGVSDYALNTTRSVTDAALNQPTFFKLKRWAIGADYNFVSNKFKGGSASAFNRSLTSQTGFFTANYDLSDTATIGVFAGFNSGKTSTDATSFDYKGQLMGITGKLHFNASHPVDIKAALVNSSLSFDSHRSILGVSDAAGLTNQKLKETSFAVQADIETMRADRWMIFTNLGLSYGNVSSSGFSENGSYWGLSVNGLSQKSTQASLGISTKYYQTLKLSYDLSAKLEKDFGSSSSFMAKYKGSTDAMSSVNNPSSGQTALAVGAGLTYKPTASSLLTAGAELRGSSDYTSDLRLNLSYRKKF